MIEQDFLAVKRIMNVAALHYGHESFDALINRTDLTDEAKAESVRRILDLTSVIQDEIHKARMAVLDGLHRPKRSFFAGLLSIFD